MKANDLIIGIIGILIVLIIGFFVGAYGLPHKEIVEKNVTVPIVTEKLVMINSTCPVCMTCAGEKIIEREIQIPCPEQKCYCKAMGAWETENGTWWGNDNKTTGYTN